jgi:hypothetical protein
VISPLFSLWIWHVFIAEFRLAGLQRDSSGSQSDIRFKLACQYIAVQLIVMAVANPVSATGRRLEELRTDIWGLFLDHRPRLSRLRTVMILKVRFPVDRTAAPLK